MRQESSRTTRKREPVYQGQKRVVGLWLRYTADGRPVYELQHRVGGSKSPSRTKLQATNQAEAIVEARGLGSDIERGVIVVGDRSVTIEALAQSFIGREKGVLGTRAKRTVELYEQRITQHVVPALGANTRAADVSVVHLRQMIDGMRRKNLSGSTIRGTRTAAAAMFRHGERDLGVLPRNVVRDLDKGDLPSAKRQTEPRYLAVADVEKLLGALSEETRPVAAACFWAALRISEALALTWADIDFDGGTVAVNGTKTEASKATIPLLPALARELRDLQRRKRAEGLQHVTSGALVFTTKAGLPTSRSNVRRAIVCASKRAGLVTEGQEAVGPHDLRHSFAANAFALGLPPTEVSRLMRHANAGITLGIYAGITEGSAETLGSKLASCGFGA